MKKLFCLLILVLAVDAEAGLRKLKQSTATTVNVHLVNATTGAGITGATIGSITGFLAKHKDTATTTSTAITFTATVDSDPNDCVEVGQGLYNCELSAANTDTLMDLTLCYAYSGAVTTCDTYTVSSTFDPEFAGDFASVDDIWALPTSGMTTVGSVGKRIADNVDAPVSLVPTAFLATVYEGTETIKDWYRYAASMLMNPYTSSAGTFDFKNIANSKTRIRYTTTATSRTTTLRDATD